MCRLHAQDTCIQYGHNFQELTASAEMHLSFKREDPLASE